MILGQTYDEQLFKSEMFRLFIDTFADNQNGIINNYKQSCVLSNTQSTITVADGAFLMQGGLIQIQGNETVEVELDNTCCILAFEIDLTQENTETEFNQGKFKVIKGTGTSYPTLQQDDIVNNVTGIYQMEFARFFADAGGISNFVDKRTFIDFTTMFENINTQVTSLINELKEKLEEAENLPIDENEYTSNDSDGNTFSIKCRRQGSIVSLHITVTLLTGAFGQRIKSQLGFPDNLVPEKYKPREMIRSKENYAITSGSSISTLAYIALLADNNNTFTIQYCNQDSQTQILELNLMYFGKEITTT